MAISEVLSQDPRASKKRGTMQTDPYRIMFCSAQVEFVVTDDVSVVNVSYVDLSRSATAEGIPLASTGIMDC